MADGELGNLRRAPRIIEHKISKQARYRTEGMAGGQFDAVIPVDVTDTISSLADSTSDGGGPVPEWFTESFTLTSGAAATLSLTYIPIDYSEILTLNGIRLSETTDYTIAENIVTWTSVGDLVLGIGSDSWTLTATYPYYDQASSPDPVADYTVANVGGLTLPRAALVDDLAIVAVSGNGTGAVPSGAFATWTKIYDGSPGSAIGEADTVDVWIGTGVGTGTNVIITAATGYGYGEGCAVLACYTNYDGGVVTLRNSTKANWTPSGGPNPAGAANVTAVVGDIVFSAVRAVYDYPNNCVPGATSTYTATGFTETTADVIDSTVVGGHNGIGIATGVATATSAGATFGIVYDVAGDGYVEAVNLAIAVA